MNEVIVEKIKKFFDLYDEIIKDKDQALIEVSTYDKELANLYHEIEGMELSHIAKSHNKLKELQALLRKRRDAKGAARLLQSFSDNVGDKVEKARKSADNVIKQQESVIDKIQQGAKISRENLQD